MAVEKAQAESESRDVALIAKAASEDWRAAAWRLERKAPRRYSASVRLIVDQQLEAAMDRLEAGLAPDVYEKVLQLIAAVDDESNPVASSVSRSDLWGDHPRHLDRREPPSRPASAAVTLSSRKGSSRTP